MNQLGAQLDVTTKATRFAALRSKAPVTRLGLVCFALAACTASAEEVAPKERNLFFPTGLAVSPDDSKLFVANANSELRYDSGSIGVIDLALVDQIAADWTVGKTIPANDPSATDAERDDPSQPDCVQDPDHTETLICEEARFFVPNSSVRIGNFATSIGVQDTGGGNLRLVVPTRGDPSIAWVDWDGSKLSCNSNAQGFELCDDTHRLSYLHDNPDLAYLPSEPFDVYVDSPGQFAVVTHLTSGDVTLIDSPIGGTATISGYRARPVCRGPADRATRLDRRGRSSDPRR